jgi:hypothetical protein
VHVIDVADPADPKEIGGVSTVGPALRVALYRDMAYVADGYGGLRIFDATDPTHLLMWATAPWMVSLKMWPSSGGWSTWSAARVGCGPSM